MFIFIGRFDSSHFDMWGDKYGALYFVDNSSIFLQKLFMKFVFEPNFYYFEYWKIELGLDWLLQHFHVVIDTFHFYVTFIINLVFSFIIYLVLVIIFLKMLHLPIGYGKMEIPLSQVTILLVFWGPKNKFS